MNDVLEGYFKAKKAVSPVTKEDDLEARFEQEAMKKLGGSIAYVVKKKVNWKVNDES